MRLLRRTAIVLTLFMGLLNGWRALAFMAQRQVLIDYGATMSITLLAAISAVWAILMLGCGIMAWRWVPGKTTGNFRFLIPLLFLTYTLYNVWLPSPTPPYLYGHLFLIFFTFFGLNFRNSQQISAQNSADSADK